MKKKQILITGNLLYEWEKRVNNYLEDGWTVVPHTLKLSAYSNVYAVVLETEKYKE